MPDSRMIYKAGKISFLLVCLFLCTACRKEKAVFQAGEISITKAVEEITETKTEEKIPVEHVQEEIPKDSHTEKINVNTAGLEELMMLPGIGETKAAAIIEYRENHGDFQENEELMNVKGIGTATFQKINSLVSVK